MALFELTDDPWDAGLEVGSSAGRPVVRLRRGTPVTADMVRMLNELLDEAEAGQGQGDQGGGTGAETPVTGAAAPVVAHTVIIVLRS